MGPIATAATIGLFVFFVVKDWAWDWIQRH